MNSIELELSDIKTTEDLLEKSLKLSGLVTRMFDEARRELEKGN